MNLAIGGLVAVLAVGLPGLSIAQNVMPAPEIIPCEGPNMPAQCPPGASTPRTMDTARQELAARQAAELQPQSLMEARLQFRQKLEQNQRDAVARQLQATQPNPLLRPPDFRAAAQVVNGVVTGVPNR